jgi:hypothetical protein
MNSIAIPPATAGDEYDDGSEYCCECGRSVAPGSGLFTNRVPDVNDFMRRCEMGRPYPLGAYLCAECDGG